ncbi:MAG: helix-turn-helix domain-containing protein, partial [Puniceicoccales bacterium]|nr:helix-turn-helix domain-containing protein [Puniceicoccales bacterium]
FPVDISREWFTAKELAALLGRTDQFVRDMVDNGRILGHTLQGRGASGRKVYQIHRSAVELYLLETANFTPSEYVTRVFNVVARLPRSDREKLRSML